MTNKLIVVAFALATLVLDGCSTGAPGAHLTATPTSPATSTKAAASGCAPESEYCDPGVGPSGVDLAPDYIARFYPEQGIGAIAGQDWQQVTPTPGQRGADWVFRAGDWIMVEDLGDFVVVTNTVTGFEWEGVVKSRAVPWPSPCCIGSNYETFIVETSVTIPLLGAPTRTRVPAATP